ncbi:hypothetical protein ACFL54_09520, partial [Planctomycetota bacterium]
GISWDMIFDRASLAINGSTVADDRWQICVPGPTWWGNLWDSYYFPAVISLGLGWPAGKVPDDAFSFFLNPPPGLNYPMNHAADSVYDDVIGYTGFTSDIALAAFWDWGRYYNVNEVTTYTSPPIDLHRKLKLDRREVLRPRSVTWTVYWPKHNRDGDEVIDNILPPNVDGDLLDIDDPDDPVTDDPLVEKWGEPLDPISIDIGVDDGSGTEWLFGNDLLYMPTYAGGSSLKATGSDSDFNIAAGQKLRYLVRFNLEPDQTLYDTPVFDDISFTFFIKPRILVWRVIH